ncbi:subtilisin-like protease SBT4.3 [Impatiens glandulifera]|uniref:subtilisin-like protease SBT4.3 n=1 Tax=Impatiens glandulifera TaxID=253017 RepID=UPI001FB050FB|nr:subtilisin-like protease SBT4.3 [Impatiens glandulifera]
MAEKTLMRSYTRSFNGFAANLTPYEASKLKNMKGVVLVFESHKLKLQTTRSWDYIGLSLDVSRNLTMESDIIIGHIDTGVRPNSDSLSDHGLGNVPKKWKGVCNGGKNFTCNKKLIGARYYIGDSAIDDSVDSHGTHTVSTAVGRVVKNANFFGIGNGTARGGVPSARIATYKACDMECDDKDILAAFDDAIADNVDIITVSIGPEIPVNISEDIVAIGSFHAMKKDILTVQGAGNTRNNLLKSVVSTVPWIFSVGASSIDRNIINKVVLKNGRTLISNTVNPFTTSKHNKKLVYGREITNHCNESSAMRCMNSCIDPSLVKGKIIVCNVDEFGLLALETGLNASGLIMRMSNQSKDVSKIVLLPTAYLSNHDFHYIESYLKSKSFPSARILKSKTIRNDGHVLGSFSSIGPNTKLPEILKPDITAPGLNILAESPSEKNAFLDIPGAKYNFRSGTSMACPHVTGVVAYVKSKHPDWSISAIKSSLMTTARTMNTKYNKNVVFGHGAGFIDPIKATHPGLVYETFLDEYMNMFCNLGLEGVKLREMLGTKEKCPKGIKMSTKDLNYPTMTAPVHTNSSFKIQFSRVVTNVGHANSIYHARVSTGDNTIYVDVEPNILSFVSLKERKKFVVTVSGHWLNQDHVSCSLDWFDGIHTVKSPILLYRSSII